LARDSRILGTLFIALGAIGIAIGAWALLSGTPFMQQGSGCKAICGLTILTVQFLGLPAGALVGGVLWLSVGVAFSLGGYRVLNMR